MAQKRIVPDVDAIGVPKSPRQSSMPNYSIVGGAGTPVGPSPLAQLSQSLSGFNRNLSGIAGALKQKSEQDALAKMPELAAGVTDAAANIAKTLNKSKLSNILNPATPSAATTRTGAYIGRRDVTKIMLSPEFREYADQEISNSGDYRQKLNDFVVGNLPNRNTGDKTTSKQWKRGYDPAVFQELDKQLSHHEVRHAAREAAEMREATKMYGINILKDVIDAGQKDFNAVDTFVQFYKDSKDSYPTSEANGITLRNDVLKTVLRPVFEQALTNPEIDVDKLSDTFEGIMKSRRKTEKGSTLLFGSNSIIEEQWFAAKVDAEATRPSLSARMQMADETELFKTLGEPLINGWEDFYQKQQSQLDSIGVRYFSDLDGNVDKFDSVVGMLTKEYSNFDRSLFERQARLNRSSLLEQLVDNYRKLALSEAEDKPELLNAQLRQTIGNDPLYSSILDSVSADLGTHITSAVPLSSLYSTVANSVEKALSETKGINWGVPEEAIGGYLATLVQERLDPQMKHTASTLLHHYNAQLDEGVMPKDASKNVRNMINQSFTGEKDIDPQLRILLGRLDDNDAHADLKSQFKFRNILGKIAQVAARTDPNSVVFTKLATSYAQRAVGSPLEEDAASAGIDMKVQKASPQEQGAANFVTEIMERDVAEYLDENIRAWAEKNVGKDLKEEFTAATGFNTIEDGLLDMLSSKKSEYEKQYSSIIQAAKTTETTDDRAAEISTNALGPFFPEKTLSLNGIYENNLREFGVFSKENQEQEEGGLTKLSKLSELKSGRTAATGFYVDSLGDTRFAKAALIKSKSIEIEADLKANLIGLIEEGEQFSAKNISGNLGEEISQNTSDQRKAKEQLKAHILKYRGINWNDVADGKANLNFTDSGRTVDIPVSYKDVHLGTSIVFDSWQEINSLESLYNRWERQGSTNKTENFVETKPEQKAKGAQNEQPLTPDEMKRVEKYVGFIEKLTGHSLFDTKNRAFIQKEIYNPWVAKQRGLMISTDLDKLPRETNIAIKEEALKTFFSSKDNVWKGNRYTNNDKARVKAVKEYNDTIVNGDFSLTEGVTPEEFLKLYSGIVGGRMYRDSHHRRGGNARGRSGGSLETVFIDTSKPLEAKQIEVIAEELTMASLGISDPTMPSFVFKGTKIHPVTHDKAKFVSVYQRMKDLLSNSTGKRSPELAQAFETLYNKSDFTKTYSQSPTTFMGGPLNPWFKIIEWISGKKTNVNETASQDGTVNLLAPFGLSPLPLPNN